jgi:pimeloyl-ACP methyl ester carboxylesterase
MRLALAITCAAAIAALAPAAAGAAGIAFAPCHGKPGVQCATLHVPIDRSGHDPGTFALHVERVPARHRTAAPIFALGGGPGDPSTASTRDWARLFAPLLATHDLIVFDQRGTGHSGAIHCAALESGASPAQALPDCAEQLGSAAHHYTTPDSADDLDAIRAALGAPKATVYGISYGTWVAQVWARRHPAHVRSLVLDSTVSQMQIENGFQPDIFRSLKHGVRAYCGAHACRVLTRDLWADGVKLYKRLLAKPLRTSYFDGSGARKTMEIGGIPLALLVVGSDIHAEQRAELPRAAHAALHGDGRFLARLLTNDAMAFSRPAFAENRTLNLVTQCEEKDFEFDRSSPPAQRLQQAQAALDQIPASVFAPFTRNLAFLESLVPTCAYWPSLPQRPDFGGPLPDVPALLLHGAQDLRSTVNDTKYVAARLPHSITVEVPQTGHSVVSTDASGCAKRALRAFLAGNHVSRCHASARYPYATRKLPPLRVPRSRRAVVRLVAATVGDGFEQLDDVARRSAVGLRRARIGGLSGGFLHGARGGPVFVGYRYVRGLAVSGHVTRRGTMLLRIAGRVTGRLSFAPSGRVSGRLRGRVVRLRVRLTRETAYERLHRRGLLPG